MIRRLFFLSLHAIYFIPQGLYFVVFRWVNFLFIWKFAAGANSTTIRSARPARLESVPATTTREEPIGPAWMVDPCPIILNTRVYTSPDTQSPLVVLLTSNNSNLGDTRRFTKLNFFFTLNRPQQSQMQHPMNRRMANPISNMAVPEEVSVGASFLRQQTRNSSMHSNGMKNACNDSIWLIYSQLVAIFRLWQSRTLITTRIRLFGSCNSLRQWQ